jgi:peptidoglycan hydrolase-like protein with peptidoglycan-binding domain
MADPKGEGVDVTIDEAPGYQRLRRRRFVLVGVVALVVVAAGGGLLASTMIKSPADLAAETKPPSTTQLSVTVSKQVITSTVLAQASVGPPTEVSPASIGGAGNAGAGAQPIVTKVFAHQGQAVHQGSLLLEVAGQPYFVLQGKVPAYRDLVPGDQGSDVTQLQEDLESLGYGVGDDTLGVYGAGTATAVSDFYTALGYTAPTVSSGPKADQGAEVPLSDYMFVPRLPAHLIKFTATVGQTISASDVTLSVGRPVLSGQLNPSDRSMVRRGMKVIITRSDTGQSYLGTITSVSAIPESTGSIAGGDYLPMTIKTKHPMPAVLVGQDVSLRITTAATKGKVLAVPESAVFASANGAIYVTKLHGTAQVRVPVRTGATGNGLVQVTPLKAGALAPGDAVLIGQNYTTTYHPPTRGFHNAPGAPAGKQIVVKGSGG